MDKLRYIESCNAMFEKLPEALQRQVPGHRAKCLGWSADGSNVATTWDHKFQPFLPIEPIGCLVPSKSDVLHDLIILVNGHSAPSLVGRFSGEEFRVEQRNGTFGCIPLGVGLVSSTCHICHSRNSRTSLHFPFIISTNSLSLSLSAASTVTVFHVISELSGSQGTNRWRIFISLASQRI